MARRSRQGPSTTDFILNSRNNSFEAQVDRIVVNTEKRLLLVQKQALIDTINEMQLVGPSKRAVQAAIDAGLGSEGRGKKKTQVQGPVAAPGKGGRMRVDTGFLRASGQASLTGMPVGPTRGAKDGSYNYDASVTEATIGNMELGVTLYWGWTAAYARYREAYDGFMYAALQNWPQTVNRIVEEAKRRFP